MTGKTSISSRQKKLIDRAKARYGKIRPCAKKSWKACFTEQAGKLTLWFNDSRGDTHVVSGGRSIQ